MVFNRFVEIGRVGLINYGPDCGKLCTIVDVLDQNRVLVDGPSNVTGVSRQQLTLKRLSLTDLSVEVARNSRQKTLAAAWAKAGTLEKFNASAWGRKLSAQKTRASLTDFQRFKALVGRKQRSSLVRREVNTLRKSGKKTSKK